MDESKWRETDRALYPVTSPLDNKQQYFTKQWATWNCHFWEVFLFSTTLFVHAQGSWCCECVWISGRGTEQGVCVTQQRLHTGSPPVLKRNWMSYQTVPVLPSSNVWPLNARCVLWKKIVDGVLLLAVWLLGDFKGRKILVTCIQNFFFFSFPWPICLFFSLSLPVSLLHCTHFFPICSSSSNYRSGLQMRLYDLHEFLVKVEQEEVEPS